MRNNFKVLPKSFPTIFENFQLALENEAIQFWKIYFDFGFLFLFIPFRFRFNVETGHYEIHKNVFQKVLRILGASVAGLYFLLKVRQMYSDTRRNPSQYFDMASYFFDTFFLIPMFLTFGRQSRVIDSVFQEMQRSQYARNCSLTPSRFRHGTKVVVFLCCLLCAAHPTLYIFQTLTLNDWKLEGAIQYFRRDAWRVFKVFLVYLPNPKDSILLNVFALISLFSNLVDKLINTYADIMFLVTVLLFRELVKYFSVSLKATHGVSPAMVLDHFKWLREVTERINAGMGIITMSFILGNLPFFATSLLNVLSEGDHFERIVNVVVCIYFFSSLFLAAKATRDVEEIRLWLWKEENYTRIHPLKLSVTLQEVTAQPVAISAFGCITVNYSTVGSIVSIIFTYALLKQQFQAQPEPP